MNTKTTFYIVTFIFVGIGIYFTLTELFKVNITSQERTSAGSIEASQTEMLNPPGIINDESKSKQKVFEVRPFPESTIPEKLCTTAQPSIALTDKHSAILKEATQAYLSGRTKEEVADAIWLELNWLIARRWYARAATYEAIDEHQASIQALGVGQSLIRSFEYLKASIATDTRVGDIADLSQGLDELWSDIRLEGINSAIFNNEATNVVVAQINEALSSIPEALLVEPELSPLKGIVVSLVSLNRIDAALELIRQYPVLTVIESKYDNQLRLNILDALNTKMLVDPSTSMVSELLSQLGFFSQNLMFYDIPPMFDSRKIKDAIKKLQQQSISFSHQIANAITPPEPSFTFEYENKINGLSKAQYQACNAQRNWMNSRKLALSQWQTFEKDEFVADVQASFEYRYCEDTQSTFDINATLEQVSKHMQHISQHAEKMKYTSLADINFNEIEFPPLSDDERSLISMALTIGLLKSKTLSEQEIVNKLTAADFLPEPSSLTVMEFIIQNDGLHIWLDTIEIKEELHHYSLLNQLAESGKFRLFKAMNERLDVDDTDLLDPFYFFILGYSDSSITIRNGANIDFDSQKAFINYFTQNAVNIEEHHLRAAFEKKITSKSNYESLIKHFPQLRVETKDDYFAVRCE